MIEPIPETASFALRGRNPDVLSCIANLSNDEVFTPPEFANRMLDTIAEAWATDHGGANIWANPNVKFLDPCTKSGVFLREITSRLVLGLADTMPDLQERVDHILTHQIYGIGITELTAMLARRSVYCSKDATGEHSITGRFDHPDGNIWFERTEHTWKNGKCIYCGASDKVLDREDDRESHAYALIHCDDPKAKLRDIFGTDMQFDVIIGNPPYQLDDGGHGASAAPIYHKFIEQALALSPRYASFVTPSRWMAGGKGLSEFRDNMRTDRRMKSVVDFPKLYEGFPGVKIRGGISYFVWQSEHDGPCSIQTIWDGQPTGPAIERYLDAYDVIVRRNEAISILEKINSQPAQKFSETVSSAKPFGLRTFFHGTSTNSKLLDPVMLFGSQKISWVERSDIPTKAEWIDRWKVLMTRVQGTSAAIETKFLSKPIIAEPGSACTETYLVAGNFETKREAVLCAQYLSTRFVRFLVSLRKSTQDAARGVYGFVPQVPLDRTWTDEMLYERFKLDDQEIAFIESQVAPHEQDFLDSLAKELEE